MNEKLRASQGVGAADTGQPVPFGGDLHRAPAHSSAEPAMSAASKHFAFAFDRHARPLLWVAGVRPDSAWVSLSDDRLSVHFGPFRLTTLLDNVFDVQVTGPYSWIKTVGVRVSMADKGVTFGTNVTRGACVRFHTPVESVGRSFGLRHPGMTVTVADPAALKKAIESRR